MNSAKPFAVLVVLAVQGLDMKFQLPDEDDLREAQVIETNDYLRSLNDKELKAAADEAYADLIKAADEDNNSEWHGTCFAALLCFCNELNKRDIKTSTIH